MGPVNMQSLWPGLCVSFRALPGSLGGGWGEPREDLPYELH